MTGYQDTRNTGNRISDFQIFLGAFSITRAIGKTSRFIPYRAPKNHGAFWNKEVKYGLPPLINWSVYKMIVIKPLRNRLYTFKA
ncbi:hypothetical protein D3C75_1153790 [compost metagenome]